MLTNPERLQEAMLWAESLRIESPGENWEVEKGILRLGSQLPGALSGEDIDQLQFDRGALRLQRQWLWGWQQLLDRLSGLAKNEGVFMWNSGLSIGKLFDKVLCHFLFNNGNIPRPRGVAYSPENLAGVLAKMSEANCSRVFIKPRSGSSASGVIALQRRGEELRATAPIEIENGLCYNSLRVRTYTRRKEIELIVDTVCWQDAIVERWFPKAGFRGRTVDLRVVTIAGEPTHWILRASKGPLTNLHLGNERGETAAFQEAMGEAWGELLELCRKTASLFPDMLTLGIDVLVAPSLDHFVVAEVNAFGDLLPGILDEQGLSTYERQAAEMRSREPRRLNGAESQSA